LSHEEGEEIEEMTHGLTETCENVPKLNGFKVTQNPWGQESETTRETMVQVIAVNREGKSEGREIYFSVGSAQADTMDTLAHTMTPFPSVIRKVAWRTMSRATSGKSKISLERMGTNAPNLQLVKMLLFLGWEPSAYQKRTRKGFCFAIGMRFVPKLSDRLISHVSACCEEAIMTFLDCFPKMKQRWERNFLKNLKCHIQ
jgi:hypothetical protein